MEEVSSTAEKQKKIPLIAGLEPVNGNSHCLALLYSRHLLRYVVALHHSFKVALV